MRVSGCRERAFRAVRCRSAQRGGAGGSCGRRRGGAGVPAAPAAGAAPRRTAPARPAGPAGGSRAAAARHPHRARSGAGRARRAPRAPRPRGWRGRPGRGPGPAPRPGPRGWRPANASANSLPGSTQLVLVAAVEAALAAAEHAADALEGVGELARDDPHLVGVAAGDLRQHLEVLVGEQLLGRLAAVDGVEDLLDGAGLALGLEDAGLGRALGAQDLALLLALGGEDLAGLDALGGEDRWRGGHARPASASPSTPGSTAAGRSP